MKLVNLCLFFLLLSLNVHAQDYNFSGRVLDESSQQGISSNIKINSINRSFNTQEDGSFSISLPKGTYSIYVNSNGYESFLSDIVVDKNITDYKFKLIKSTIIPTVLLDDDELDNAQNDNVSSLLSASRDVFTQISGFNFGIARFTPRGYANTNNDVYINGAPMTNLEDERTSFSDWGGLNDAFRFRDNTIGLEANDYVFGGLNGATTIDSRAGKQRKGTRINYAFSNRGYDHRLMATHHSGLSTKKWAYSIALSRRWANNGAIPGTYNDAYSGYLSIEKQIAKHSICLSIIDAPSKRALNEANIKELYELSGSNIFNTTWGYQEDLRRNTNVNKRHLPIAILTHELKPDVNTQWTTAVSFQKGNMARQGLNFYNAQNPNPEYYRNLPYYWYLQGDSVTGNALSDAISADPEKYLLIDWAGLYQANQNVTDTTINGATGNWARYYLADDHQDPTRVGFNTSLVKAIGKLSIHAALRYQFENVHKYRQMVDLLGADFFVNLDQFAALSTPNNTTVTQNDLNNPNKIIKEGDVFEYEYYYKLRQLAGFLQGIYSTSKADVFAALDLTRTQYWREGLMQNGQFPNSSFGTSEKKSFIAPSLKAGLSFKIDGRNYVTLNAGMLNNAPQIDNTLLAAEVRNDFITETPLEKILSGELNYHYRGPYLKGRATAYYTQTNDRIINRSFFHDGYNNMVNYLLTGVNTNNKGVELAAEAKLVKGFSLTAACAFGIHRYTSRPTATILKLNDATYQQTETVYLKNFNLATGPQEAYHAGLRYNSPKFWFANISANYFKRNYADINPVRRTISAVDNVTDSKSFAKITDQEKLPSFFSLDFFAGYSWKLDKTFSNLKKPQYLGFNLGISNLLNNTNIITSAREQLRYEFAERNPDYFPTKYFYAQGLTYFASVTYRF